ncbi:hypothetical protein TL16_g02141 [Triparma laevis f. inornata]|nr:hypothetical protein TL16_g02141 [Triparma laevis f. inornata]
MIPRQLASSNPECTKTTAKLSQPDLVKIPRGIDYLSKTIGDDGDAVGKCFKCYLAIRENDRNPLLEEALVHMSLLIVFVQNYKKTKRLLREFAYVLTFTKPGVDAYRVAIGAEAEVGSMFAPKSELIYTKGAELFTEAIPGTMIQMYAFLTGSNHSSTAIFSLIVSVVTAAFTSNGLSFDQDLDKEKRKHSPDFYGYVPEEKDAKAKTFLAMFIMASCQLGGKAFACALGAVEGPSIVAAYIGLDILFFIFYKLVRRDFWYW